MDADFPTGTGIVYLIDKLAYGGTPLQVMELAMNLDRLLFEPYFIALSSMEPELGRRLAEGGIGFEVIGQSNWTRPGALKSAIELYHALARRKPRIIHAFLATSNVLSSTLGKLACDAITISSHRDLGGFDGKTITRVNGWLDNWLANCVTANSQAVRQTVSTRSGIASDRIKVIYNGIDIERMNLNGENNSKRRELGIASEDVVLTTVANIKPAKGHRFLIEAFNRIAPRFPRAKLLLCGYIADSTFADHLRILVKQAHTETQIRFLGSRSDIPEILMATDIVIAPSLSEGFSNSILEAMAAGKPVIATRVGGNREQVVDGESGYLISPADAGALEEKMETLLRSPQQRQAMGQAAFHRAQSSFSLQRMVAEHERLYSNLIQRRN